MGVADCVTYGGDYPGGYAFRDNTTKYVTKAPTIGHTAASV